jgi:Ca2+/Na+ antiporter
MIEGYGFVDHALPRMLPSLAFVALASLAWLVPLRSAGSHGWILLGGVAVVTLAAWGASTVLVQRLRRFSRRTAIAILAAYATMPVAVPLLQLAVDGAVTPPGGSVVGLLGFVIFFAAAFVATLLATTYGLGTLLRRAVRHSVFDLRNSVHLLGRALPALLFVTLFLFFTGELWQAMNRLAWWRVVLVVVLFAAITVLAAAARLRDEIGRVEQDLSRPTLAAACRDTPLADVPVEQLAPDGQLPAMPLTPRQERNLLLMLASRQLVQAAVVGLALFTFFLALGVLVVTPGTAGQWIGEKPQMSALLPVLPVAMLRNATLLAAFGSMYFAVTSMTDADHRQRFFAPIIDEIEHVLTVHAVYLTVRERVPAEPRGPGGG